MSFGLPVIATPVGGVADYVEHEDNGLLVPPGRSRRDWPSPSRCSRPIRPPGTGSDEAAVGAHRRAGRARHDRRRWRETYAELGGPKRARRVRLPET
jgi:glycosyltransferase involved in cell wall biosynthesis